MRTVGKLVDKVRILALVFLAPFALLACGEKDGGAELEPTQIVAAADSAGSALDGKLAILRDSANRPSIFFDTLYAYYSSARRIEVQKRLDADSLSRAAVLAIYNVKDRDVRQTGIKTLLSFLERDSTRNARIASLQNSLRESLERMLDSTTLTATERMDAARDLSSTKRFSPEYRQELDSLTHGTIMVELEMLRFLDEASSRIQFEEVLRFRDANDLARYQRLTSHLSELATAQQLVVDRITYGVQPPSDSLSADSVTAPVPPSPKPVQSWPDAVRIQ